MKLTHVGGVSGGQEVSEMGNSEGLRRAAVFTIAAFTLACLVGFGFQALGGTIGQGPWFGVMGFLYMWIPALTAIVLQKWVYKERVIGPLGVSFRMNRWWLAAIIVPPIAVYLAFGIGLLMPDVSVAPTLSGALARYRGMMPADQYAEAERKVQEFPSYFRWLALLAAAVPAMLAGATVNAVGGFGEELGWRGFMQRALGHLGFWRSSFVIGVIWGIWHAPLVIQGANYPHHRVVGLFMMVVIAVLLAPIFAYIRLRSGSVIAAAILHGTFNAAAGISVLLIRGGNDLTVGITGLAGAVSLALINLGLFLYDPDPCTGVHVCPAESNGAAAARA